MGHSQKGSVCSRVLWPQTINLIKINMHEIILYTFKLIKRRQDGWESVLYMRSNKLNCKVFWISFLHSYARTVNTQVNLFLCPHKNFMNFLINNIFLTWWCIANNTILIWRVPWWSTQKGVNIVTMLVFVNKIVPI